MGNTMPWDPSPGTHASKELMSFKLLEEPVQRNVSTEAGTQVCATEPLSPDVPVGPVGPVGVATRGPGVTWVKPWLLGRSARSQAL